MVFIIVFFDIFSTRLTTTTTTTLFIHENKDKHLSGFTQLQGKFLIEKTKITLLRRMNKEHEKQEKLRSQTCAT